MSEHPDEKVTEAEDGHVDSSHDDSGHGSADGGPGDSIHIDKFEGAWIRISVVVVLVFIVAVTVSSFAVGVQLPGQYARIQPKDFSDPNNPFSDPGLRELAPGKYEAYITAQIWSFTPAEIRVPVGSEVTFYVTARDVQHGFKLIGTNVNMMALPGQVSTLKAVFDEPGTYDFICHEYCGYIEGSPIGHHTMYGQVIVEGPDEAETAASE